MKINDILASAYTSLINICRDTRVINEGKTCDDYINDVVLQALRKYRNKNVEWEEGYEYLTSNIYLELYFSKKRPRPIEFVGGLGDLPIITEEGDLN